MEIIEGADGAGVWFLHSDESSPDDDERYMVASAGSVSGEGGLLATLFLHRIVGRGESVVGALTTVLREQRERLARKGSAMEIEGGWAKDGTRAVYFVSQSGCAVCEVYVPIPLAADLPKAEALHRVLTAGQSGSAQ